MTKKRHRLGGVFTSGSRLMGVPNRMTKPHVVRITCDMHAVRVLPISKPHLVRITTLLTYAQINDPAAEVNAPNLPIQ